MEKESTRTSLSYEHQRQIRKSGIRKGHESWATPKIISMRNNPKAPCWEKSKAVLGGQQGRSAEVGCARGVLRSSQGPCPCQFLHHNRSLLSPPDTPAAARPQTGLLGSGTGRGKTTGPAEQVGTCQEFNLALLNYPAQLDFPCHPPSISWDYLVQRWGENDTGGGRTWSISLKSGLMSPPQRKGADRAAVKFNCPQDNVLQCRIYYTFILKTCRLNTLSLNDF